MKKQYIIILAAIGLIFGYSQPAFSQIPSNASGGLMGYFQIGNSGMDLSELNTPLKASGFSAMKENFTTLGGGGHLFYKRLVLGGEGASFIPNVTTNGSNVTSARLSGGNGFANVGFLVYNGLRWKIYPMLGIGGGRYNLEIIENQNPYSSLNYLLSNPQAVYDEKLQTSGFLLNLSLNISMALPASGSKGSAGPITLGIRGGYIIQPWMNPWIYDYSSVPNSSMCMQGWYAMFQVGIGFWTKPAKPVDALPAMPLPED